MDIYECREEMVIANQHALLNKVFVWKVAVEHNKLTMQYVFVLLLLPSLIAQCLSNFRRCFGNSKIGLLDLSNGDRHGGRGYCSVVLVRCCCSYTYSSFLRNKTTFFFMV